MRPGEAGGGRKGVTPQLEQTTQDRWDLLNLHVGTTARWRPNRSSLNVPQSPPAEGHWTLGVRCRKSALMPDDASGT
jgi:hypothetical protein